MESNFYVQVHGGQDGGKTTVLNIILNALILEGYSATLVSETAAQVLMSTETQIKGVVFSSKTLKVSKKRNLTP